MTSPRAACVGSGSYDLGNVLLPDEQESKRSKLFETDKCAGDASFKYVEQARGNSKNSRVYVLKFTNSPERLFFWMQEPAASRFPSSTSNTPILYVQY